MGQRMVFEPVLGPGKTAIDFSDVPFVDQHAHAMTYRQPESGEQFRSHFSEAHHASIAVSHVPSSVAFRWAVNQLSRLLGVEASASAILEARAAMPLSEYSSRLAGD